MPVVSAHMGRWFNGAGEHNVLVACEEVIPAALNTRQGPLNPGNVLFEYRHAALGLEDRYDLFIQIEADPFEDRTSPLARANAGKVLRGGFTALLPSVRLLLRLKFVEADWWSTEAKVPFDPSIDMSLEAAIARAQARMTMWDL